MTMLPYRSRIARLYATICAVCLLQTVCLADGALCRGHAFAGMYNESIRAEQLEIVGDIAYVAGVLTGVHILDISDPTSPTLLSRSLVDINAILDIKVVDNTAYIAAGSAGLIVVDVLDPTNPVILAEVPTEGYTFRIDVEDDVAFLASSFYFNGISAFDVSDPAHPSLLGIVEAQHHQIHLDARDGILYYTNGDSTFIALDVQDPSSMAFIGGIAMNRAIRHFVIDGDVACFFGYESTSLVDISDPRGMKPLGVEHAPASMGAYDHATQTTYLLQSGEPFKVFDVSSGDNWEYLGSFDTYGSRYDIIIHDHYAFIATGRSGLHVLDISAPREESLITQMQLDSPGNGFAFRSHYAYVASEDHGLKVIDFDDPSSPELVAQYETPGETTDIQEHGGYVYLQDDAAGVLIFDALIPDQPQLVSTIEVSSMPFWFCIDSDRAYIANAEDGLVIYDISDPSSPVQLGSYLTKDGTSGIAVDGDTAYCLTSDRRAVQIIDVSNPQQPLRISAFEPETSLHDFIAHDGIFYAIRSQGYLEIYDVADPHAVTHLSSFELSSNVFLPDLRLIEYTTLLSLVGSATTIVDVADPTRPRLAARPDTGTTRAAAVSGSLLFTGYPLGIRIFDLSDCPLCPADLNGDQQLNMHDVSIFLDAYLRQLHTADYTTDGVLDFFDVSGFLNAFNAGCP